jgi:beta-mannanase
VAGDHDALVRERAADARALGVPFFLRWGHEMNGNWYPWDGFHNGAAAGGPALYVQAYRHVHDLFVEEGAENAVWVLCPNVTSVPPEPWNDWQSYYPGDEYVDWLCTDGYNWGTVQTWSSWQSFSSVMGPIIPSLASFGKPVLIAETSSTEEGGDKGAWIDGIVPALASEFPAVRGLVWFHVNKETDWRIDSSPGSLAAFIALGQAPLVNP